MVARAGVPQKSKLNSSRMVSSEGCVLITNPKIVSLVHIVVLGTAGQAGGGDGLLGIGSEIGQNLNDNLSAIWFIDATVESLGNFHDNLGDGPHHGTMLVARPANPKVTQVVKLCRSVAATRLFREGLDKMVSSIVDAIVQEFALVVVAAVCRDTVSPF